MDRVSIDLERRIGDIDRNVFGGFVEHLGRCVHGGIYEPGSPRSGPDGLRTDVLEAARRLRYSNIRYPGGNYVSAYRWRDGVGPVEERPGRYDPAWDSVEPNTFGTNEFIGFCRKLGAEPYLVVNCGDGEMREARDWVEYCNGNQPTALAKLRASHGFPEPHRVKYWGIGNEVDGAWQVGFKTPLEYARAYTEFAKVMRWADPSIKLLASAVSYWEGDPVERIQLLLEQSAEFIDYLSVHWYVGNPGGDLPAYLAVSELIEDRLAVVEGLSRSLLLQRTPRAPIPIAVDEWNVWYKATPDPRDPAFNGLEEVYDLADALVVAMHFNAFFRHARTVRMANLAQLVNVIAPMVTTMDDLLLQSTYYPFELYARTAGPIALDALWSSDTYSARHIENNFIARESAWSIRPSARSTSRRPWMRWTGRSASTWSTATSTGHGRWRSPSCPPDRRPRCRSTRSAGRTRGRATPWTTATRSRRLLAAFRSPEGPRSRSSCRPTR